jgi:hypothetical protein
MNPEVGVSVTDATVFGHNYFNCYSALKRMSLLMTDERAEILADALALKKAATDYMHPEVGVTSADGACFGRNCFSHYSAPKVEDVEGTATDVLRSWPMLLLLRSLLSTTCIPRLVSLSLMPLCLVAMTSIATLLLTWSSRTLQDVTGANLPSTESVKLSSTSQMA